jgi:hypothetical protein
MPKGLLFYITRLSSLQRVYSVLAFFLFLGLGVDVPAFSQTHYTMTSFLRCTRENAIMKAFYLMKECQGERSLRQIVHKPIRVVFKNMAEINKSLKNYDALSWMSNRGEHVIFVNEKHRSAPPEALAALLSHEAMHDDEFNSLNEEVESWKFEAEVWMELKAKNPTLPQIPKGINALVDRENRLENELRQGTLEKFVRSSPGYKGLPEDSPGFGQQQASQ